MIPKMLRFLSRRDYGSVLKKHDNSPFSQQQIKELGSLFHTKSQINVSLAIQTTQQVVSERLESEPGDSQL